MFICQQQIENKTYKMILLKRALETSTRRTTLRGLEQVLTDTREKYEL